MANRMRNMFKLPIVSIPIEIQPSVNTESLVKYLPRIINNNVQHRNN